MQHFKKCDDFREESFNEIIQTVTQPMQNSNAKAQM